MTPFPCRLGQGTWRMGQGREGEADALRLGLDLGLRVIDTAEMYGEGAAERIVAQAIAGRRDEAFIVSKVYPQNAGRRSAIDACERSLARLKIETIDLYLLHWRGGIPLTETIEAFEHLRQVGKIANWGVSNLDTDDMEELINAGGEACATNQVLYNPEARGIEFDLLPWCAQRQMPVMAYAPIGGNGNALLRHPALRDIAKKHAATPAQIALAWALRDPNLIAIPKAATPHHVRDNAAATAITLDPQDLQAIDRTWPPPRRKQALALL